VSSTPSISSARQRAPVRIPSITTWTRLEPQPRDAALERSLQAQVRDPLWMLARQWQVGEFAADDGGSPVQTTLGIETRAVTGYRAGAAGGAVVPFDNAAPTEVQVERGALHLKVRGAVQLGLLFDDLAQDAGLSQAVIDAFRAAFPIGVTDPAPTLAGTDGLRLRALAAGRCLDGEALARSVQTERAGGAADPPLPPQAADPVVAAVLDTFVGLRESAFSEPAGDSAWQPEQLSYAFAVEAASDGGGVVLEADEFSGGHLDWHSFTAATSVPQSKPVAAEYTTINMLPIHVTFHGMPSDRWWGFEDAQTDFGQLDVQHVDLAKLLVMEFALVYGSDWFSIPVPSRFGTLQTVTTLVVTDTFGERTLIRPVEQYPVDGTTTPWSMFKVSDAAGALRDFLLLAPVLGVTDDPEPVENVLFARDNMAAMAWAVEQKLQGALDVAVDAYECYLARLRATGQPQPATPAPDMPALAYTLEQPPPDNWIPLVPVLRSLGAAAIFRRGTMDLPGPGNTIIQVQPHAELLGPGAPFYLTDRVVTPIGVTAQRRLRRTRMPDGTTLTWMARRSGPGRGPAASGLKFDFLRDAAIDNG
jgi:hypothetical protein